MNAALTSARLQLEDVWAGSDVRGRSADDAPPPGWRKTPAPGILAAPLPLRSRRPFPVGGAAPPLHAFSVDVEDWQQSVLDHDLPVSDRFAAATMRLAELLDRCGVRATFFVLGNAARKNGALVAELHRAGHEIQIHGYDHVELGRMTPRLLREDLIRARSAVEDLIGAEIYGYRAPRFSLDAGRMWALDVLAECGFRYDSSIFPMRVRSYGVSGWLRGPHRLRTQAGCEIVEVPPAVVDVMGRSVPMAGGGYFRLLPWPLIWAGIRRMERAGLPATVYCHPYEIDTQMFAALSVPVSWRLRLHQGLGRRFMTRRLEKLLMRFRFGPIRDLIGAHVLAESSRPVDGVPRSAAPAPAGAALDAVAV